MLRSITIEEDNGQTVRFVPENVSTKELLSRPHVYKMFNEWQKIINGDVGPDVEDMSSSHAATLLASDYIDTVWTQFGLKIASPHTPELSPEGGIVSPAWYSNQDPTVRNPFVLAQALLHVVEVHEGLIGDALSRMSFGALFACFGSLTETTTINP